MSETIPTTPGLPLEALEAFETLATISAQTKELEELKKAINQRLEVMVQLGELNPDEPLAAAGKTWTRSPGKPSYKYPAEVVTLEAQLMEAKQTAIATGTATATPGAPFWTGRNA
jgi:hypothetical protein